MLKEVRFSRTFSTLEIYYLANWLLGKFLAWKLTTLQIGTLEKILPWNFTNLEIYHLGKIHLGIHDLL